MANTGYKGFTNREEYYTDDNTAVSGTSEANSAGTNYIAPVYDITTCPNGLYGNSAITGYCFCTCTTGYIGTSVGYVIPANTYYAATQIQADILAEADIYANAQTYADVHGSCSAKSTITLNWQLYVTPTPHFLSGENLQITVDGTLVVNATTSTSGTTQVYPGANIYVYAKAATGGNINISPADCSSLMIANSIGFYNDHVYGGVIEYTFFWNTDYDNELIYFVIDSAVA